MNEEIKKLTIQVHLTEFSALRDEILTLIKWGKKLVTLSLSISGALFSFALINQTYWSALYLIVPLSTLIGWLWIGNHLKTITIGDYIKQNIAPKINHLLNSQLDDNNNVLEWEEISIPKIRTNWKNITDWLAYLMTFVGSGILSLFLLLAKTTGSFGQRICELEFPYFFLINIIMVVIVVYLFIKTKLNSFKYIRKSIFT